jgi:hypothetical protein
MPHASRSGKPMQTAPPPVFPLSGMRKLCKHEAMFALMELSRDRRARCARLVLSVALLVELFVAPARAEGCAFEPQGEGRVAAVIDARGFRLADGREVRLAGIEPALSATTKKGSHSRIASHRCRP